MRKNNFRRYSKVLLVFVSFLLATDSFSENLEEVNINGALNIPNKINVSIDKSNYKKYKLSVIRGFYSRAGTIPRRFKKKVTAKILIEGRPPIKAKVRLTGDYTDHIRIKDVISSLRINLKEGNIGGITKFKLLLPGTRNSQHEVFTTVLLEKLGFIAPYTKMVDVDINGYITPMLFQEVPAKEMLERYNLREAPILEGDERQYYTNYIFRAERALCCTARLDNSKWASSNIRNDIVQNGLSLFTSIMLTGDESTENDSHHEFYLSDSSYREIMLLLGAGHGLSTHNRKFYYDPMYNILKPIYYDGDPTLDSAYSLKPSRISSVVRDKILKPNFISDVISEYKNRAGNIDEKSLLYLQNLEGKPIKRVRDMVDILEKLVSTVKKDYIPTENIAFERKNNFYNYLMFKSALFDKFNKSVPYSFVTKEYDNNSTLLCVLNNIYENISIRGITFTNNSKVECKEVEESFYNKAVDGALSFRVPNPPYKIHVQTPGFMYVDGLSPKKYSKEYLAGIVDDNTNVIKKVKGFTGSNVQYLDQILFPVQRFAGEVDYYSYEKIKNNDTVRININTTHYIFFDRNTNLDGPNTIKFIIETSPNKSGRVVLLGDLSRVDLITATGVSVSNNNLIPSKDRFNDRLLTGCLTILDAKINDLKINGSNLNCEDAINIVRSNGNNVSVNIDRAKHDALDVDFSDIKFNLIKVSKSGNDCVDLSAGNYTFSNIAVDNCGDKGVSVGEGAKFSVQNLLVNHSKIGLASKDGSSASIDSAIMKNTKICLSSYNKKSEFNGGSIIYRNINPQCNNKNVTDKQSSIVKSND